MDILNLIVIIIVLGLLAYLVIGLLKSNKRVGDPCPACEGKGFQEELRGRVKCPVCKGSGRK